MKFISLIIILVYSVLLVKCGIYDFTTTMNIKDSEGIPLNERYALPSETGCTFTYWIFINDTNSQQLIGFSGATSTIGVYNDTVNYRYLTIVNYNKAKGESGTITIQATLSQSTLQLTKSFSCIETPKASFIVYQKNNSAYPYLSYSSTYFVISKFLNYTKYSPGSISSGNSLMPGLKPIVPTRTFFNTILFQIVPFYSETVNPSLDSSALTVFNNLFSVPFQHIFKQYLPLSTSFGQLSQITSSYNSYWFCYTLFVVDSSYSKYYFNTFDDTSTASKYLFKVKSNSSNSTYLNIIQSVNGLKTYSLAAFDGSKLKPIFAYNIDYTYPNIYQSPSQISVVGNSNFKKAQLQLSTNGYYGPIVFSGDLLSGIQRTYQYPFGVVYTSQNRIDYSLVFITPPYSLNSWWSVNLQFSANTSSTLQTLNIPDSVDSGNNALPKVTLLDYKDNGDSFSIIIGASHSSGIASISINLCSRTCLNIVNPSHLVQGTIYNGIYSYPLSKTRVGLQYAKADITLKARNGYSKSYQLYDVYNDNFDYIKALPFYEGLLSPDIVKRIYFEKNDVDVSAGQVDNTMYIETTQRFDNFIFGFSPNFMISFKPPGVSGQYFFRDESDPQFTSTWNAALNCYEIKFKIPANIFGPVSYIITPLQLDNTFFYQYLPNGAESELRVFSSNSNILPPIFKNVQTMKNGNTISFVFTLSESSNTLSYGVININSDYDMMGRNMTFNGPPNGSVLEFSFQIYDYDRPQEYRVSYVWLNDSSGHISEYPSKTKVNPLMWFMENPLAYSYKYINDSYPLDTIAPTIQSFQVSTSNLNETNRTVEFTFMAKDQGSTFTSGLSTRLLPVVYLSSSNFTVISSVASIVNSNFKNDSLLYSASITISQGFGYPEGILISVFGLIDNNLNSRGYTSDDLESQGFQSFINSSISEGPFISNVQFNSGTLTISGLRLGLSNTLLKVSYQFSSLVDSITEFVSLSDKQIITDKVKDSVYENYVSVKVITSDGLESNSVTFKIGNSQLTQSPTSSNNQCPGSPVPCGGPLKGQCDLSTLRCTCFEPYNGDDCTSTSTGTEGEVNQENPNVNFTYVDSNSEYKSYIVIHSLVELDISGIPVETYIFKNWSLLLINSNTYQFNTTFKSKDSTGSTTIDTHLIVNITKFDKKTEIIFANQTLSMEASTLKYSMTLDQYLFKNQLNSLKLFISASLESSQTKDTCSLNQFTDQSDSNFVKIAVNNIYLYGKFYKRSIIDGLVTQVTQNLETQNATSTSSKSETYIAINIPNYRRQVILDPDFSVLVNDKNTNSNDPNSICSSNGLSKAQLTGIIVGSAMFLVVVLIIGSIILFRKSTTFRLVYYKLTKKNKSKKVELNQMDK